LQEEADVEKPLLKAGKKHHLMKSLGHKYYPIVSRFAMNAVAHPFGNRVHEKNQKPGLPLITNAPPGRER
jgi:large subunit ribosomal protein L2